MRSVFMFLAAAIGAALMSYAVPAGAAGGSPATPLDASSAARPAFDAAEAKMKAGDWRGAIETFTKAIALNPQLGAAYLDRGNCYAQLGELNTALADFDKAVELEPTSAGALESRGVVREGLGDAKGALQDFDRAATLAPTDPGAFVDRARAEIELKNYDAARADFDHAIQLDLRSDAAFGGRAELRAQRGDLSGAQDDIAAAINLAPQQPVWILVRGMIRYVRGQKDAAVADLTSAQDKFLTGGDDSDARLTGALLEEMQSGKLRPEALFAPGSPIGGGSLPLDNAALAETYDYEGEAAVQAGRYGEAVADFSKALKFDPKDKIAFSERGWSYIQLNHQYLAVKDLRRAIELGAPSNRAYYNLVLAYHELGDAAGIEWALTALVRAYPSNYEARIERAGVRASRRELDGAMADLTSAIKINPKTTRAYLMRAEMRKWQHDWRGAVDDFGKVIALDKNNAEAYYGRGMARTQNDLKGALADLQTAKRLFTAQQKPLMAQQAARAISEVETLSRP